MNKTFFAAVLAGATALAFDVWADATTPSYENCVAGTATCQTKTRGGVTVYYTVDNGEMTIYGPTAEGQSTTVPDGAFYYNLKSEMPEGVTSIKISGNVSEIGNNAFRKAVNITNIDLTGVQSIGTSSFSEAASLTSAILTGVETIGNSAFYDVLSLTNVDLTGVKTIYNQAFSGTSLTSVDLSDVETVGSYAFKIGSLKNVIMGDNATSVGYWAFYQAGSGSVKVYCQEGEGKHDGKTCSTLLSENSSKGSAVLFTKGDDGVYVRAIKDYWGNLLETYYYSSADKMMTGGVEEGCETQETCAAVVRLAAAANTTTEVQNADGSTSIYENGQLVSTRGKRIYTVEEASRLSKETGNTFKLRYK